MGEPVTLITSKTDQEKADEYRAALTEAMGPVLKILTDANKEGLTIQVGFGPNAFKQIVLTQLTIAKLFE